MHRRERFSRRHFLRNAGTTAVLGAAGASSLVHPRSAAARDGHPDGNPASPFP
ncbi:MAG: twin-arginine translocation signal domain-containing protein, partial [Gemmatimonadetes bacterium]|nr:twin-arginine translocation signal domain-containing protein [Gemmatimonadota bacterium]